VVQLVESFRNEEGKPRQRVLASLGDAAIPQTEFKAIYTLLGIDWKRAYTPQKMEVKP
jgi:hypothetical protein